jgi:hypothetical protein
MDRLSMTDDQELIARLREGATWDDDIAAADRIEALEAKLAKVVEALKNLTDCVDDGCFCSEMQMASAMDIARAILAENKGESHD